MVVRKGADWAYGRPGGAALAAAGATFVMRYVPYPGAPGLEPGNYPNKGLTRTEIADYHAHGIAVGLVFESTADRSKGGYANGTIDGAMVSLAREALGWPKNVPVYYVAQDTYLPREQFSAVGLYFDGVRKVTGGGAINLGGYGSHDLVKYLYESGRIAWNWQTTAWSDGQLYDMRHMLQRGDLGYEVINGVETDVNEGYGTTQGLWEPSTPPPPQEEEPLTAEENKFLRMREAIRGVASSLDDATVLKAYAALEATGLVPPST